MSAQNDSVEQGAALFDQLYANHARVVHAYFLGRTGDDQVAADLLQETFLRVWRRLDALEQVPAERRHFWLFSIAGNLLTDAYRRQASQEKLVQSATWQVQQEAERPVGGAQHDGALDVEAAIACLPEDLRVVLAMSIIAEMTSTEIGEALGRPPGTVRYQLAQARARLARELGLVAEPDLVGPKRVGKERMEAC
jgi:RNA polymerase sigma-70 factor, ECF subfamily